MKKWTNGIISVVSIVAIISIVIVAFYLTRPLVIYIESPNLTNLSLSPSKTITPNYRLKVVSPDGYQEKNEDLVILDPLSFVDTDKRTAVWGRSDDDVDIHIYMDEVEMYSLFSSIPFIYPEGDLYAENILSLNPSLVPVPYSGRITNVNIGSVMEAVDGYESVILFDPGSATSILDSINCNIFVDFRYYPALSKYKNVKSIAPDWDGAIKEALSIDSGDVSFDFALR